MSKNDDALRCAEYLQGMVQTYPQTSEDEPGGYCSQADEAMDAAVGFIRRLVAENEAMKTVMIAAAEEIHEHWDAHCDAEGYGPANLMRRLEEGIPSQYGYTAGRFAELQAENEAQAALLRQAEEALVPVSGCVDDDGCGHCRGCRAEAAVAAIQKHQENRHDRKDRTSIRPIT